MKHSSNLHVSLTMIQIDVNGFMRMLELMSSAAFVLIAAGGSVKLYKLYHSRFLDLTRLLQLARFPNAILPRYQWLPCISMEVSSMVAADWVAVTKGLFIGGRLYAVSNWFPSASLYVGQSCQAKLTRR